MTREEVITECKRRSKGGEDMEAIIGYLRTAGCSKIDSIAVLVATYSIDLAGAKEIVHFSRTWADARAADEIFHESIADALTKLQPGDLADGK